jgi:glycosyltransferase involved in cell wall biosynthesis
MHLLVISSKPCWRSNASHSGYATDGGFPFQMQFLSQLFDSTLLAVPVLPSGEVKGELPLSGRNVNVLPLDMPRSSGMFRKILVIPWLIKNGWPILHAVRNADAVHAPIPGDIPTLGMLAAFILHKPLFVRHCGNWAVQRTLAERFWRWFMERYGGGRNVMLATGGMTEPPSRYNLNLAWIFSTSLTEHELQMLNEKPKRDSGLRLIIVCRQEVGKGTDLLVRSLPLILEAFPDASLDVVGDGSALPQLKMLASEIGVEQKVSFHGRVGHQQVLELLHRATLFCYPTRSEGFPKAVLEALACGLPVVTTRVSVLTHLISRGCGQLLDEATPNAITQAVKQCLTDEAAYLRMSLAAREVARGYSLECWRDTIGVHLRAQWGPLTANV